VLLFVPEELRGFEKIILVFGSNGNGKLGKIAG
jgi:hypothetical protein